MSVIPFVRKEKEEETTPHVTGAAVCLDCKHEWVDVREKPDVPDDRWLQCPACTTHKGRYKYEFALGTEEWKCYCGNTLFRITPAFTYCPACGRHQTFT